MSGQSYVEHRIFVDRKARRAHPYYERDGGFVQISKGGLRELTNRLADHSLGMQAVRVLVAMAENVDYENRVTASQKELSAYLGIDQSSLAKAATALVECGFLERMSRRGWYRISPRLLWRGSAKTLKQALEEREAA